MNATPSTISICYTYVRNQLPAEEICFLTHKLFNEFYAKVKNKKVDDKCLQFMLFRQRLISYISNEYFTNETDFETMNSLVDYFDCSFAIIFFNNKFNLSPINEIIDDEFFFALLPFVIDRIEFPSIVREEIANSLTLNNRKKIKLQRRNFLANLLLCSRDYVDAIMSSLLNQLKAIPTFSEINRFMKRNKSAYLRNVANVTARHEKMFLKNKTSNSKYIVYRGYDISANENVIIDRKIRRQDVNKSFSFTANSAVAEMFATYKTMNRTDAESTTYDDRITLVSSFVNPELIQGYQSKTNRKHIVAKFEINEEDIIVTPFSTTTAECEVFAVPDNAKLIRYSIVYAS